LVKERKLVSTTIFHKSVSQKEKQNHENKDQYFLCSVITNTLLNKSFGICVKGKKKATGE